MSVAEVLLVFLAGYSVAWYRSRVYFSKQMDFVVNQCNQRLRQTTADYQAVLNALKEEHATHLRYLGQNRAESE